MCMDIRYTSMVSWIPDSDKAEGAKGEMGDLIALGATHHGWYEYRPAC